jgi:hypothetical protein
MEAAYPCPLDAVQLQAVQWGDRVSSYPVGWPAKVTVRVRLA